MKSLLLSLFLCFITAIFAQTNVSGGIYQNTTWSMSGSPYVVTGSVVVFPGKTLTIEPGVEIQINNQTASNIYIETRGTLNCVGTDQLPIKIHALYDTMSNVAWQGFVCTNSQGGVLNADRVQISNAYAPFAYETIPTTLSYTNSMFIRCFQAINVGTNLNLSNCEFIDNEVGVYGWANFNIDNCFFKDNTTSIFAYASAFNLSNCNFVDNQIGVSFQANAVDAIVITNCEFSNNGLALGYPNNAVVQNCVFNDNTTAIQYAYEAEIFDNQFFYNELALEASVNTNVYNNQINENFGGIRISGVSNVGESPEIFNNEICANINFNVDNNTNMNYSLLSNCFCGLDSSQIEALLIDGYDDITKGLINYQIFDTSCNVVLGTVLKFGEGAGIEEQNIIVRFENPVSDVLQILAAPAVQFIEVKDLSGITYVLPSAGNNHFNVAALAPGFYMLSALGKNPTQQAFIKL